MLFQSLKFDHVHLPFLVSADYTKYRLFPVKPIELSVGFFATIITMHGILVPQEFSADPIFLDQVLLIYIALFLFILLYKHEAIKYLKRT